MKTFPIQGHWSKKLWKHVPYYSIPWDMIAPHEAQARANHAGQSLEKLAQRLGLSDCEAIAVLEDRPWRMMGDPAENREALCRLVEAYEAKKAQQ